MSGDSGKKAASTADVLRVYWLASSPYKWSLILIVLGVLILQGGTLAAPWFLRQFFNLLATNHYSPEIVGQLMDVLMVVVLIWLVEWAGRRIQDLVLMYFQARAMAELLSGAFEYLLGHSYNFFVSSFAGSLTHKVSKFGRAFEIISDALLLQFFPTFLFVFGAIVVLFTRNHWLGIALAAWSVLFMAFQIYVSKIRQPARVARAEADTKVTATLADAISNQATMMLFSGEQFEKGLFAQAVALWRKATVKLWLTDNLIWAGIGLFMIVIEGGLLYGGVLLWQRGAFTVGDFVLVQAYLLTTFDRLVSINRELRRFYSALADAGEMVAILHTKHEIRDKRGAKQLAIRDASVHFDDVTFGFYADSILKNFNLTIRGGERVALVGPSGAGKSTVTKLLLRLYDLQKGAILIDGQNISEVTQNSLRDAIAFVPQEPILFHRTLMENIRYGRRDASDKEVLEAAKQAHCDEFISKLPLGYDTFVGERGIKLSGGERQRVAIARAILKNAPILVLDEATSSLDSESEALIQDALETLMQGKTVVVIAHRLSTIMKMDRIVVMEQGAIVAQGTHLELVNQRGLYQKLWSIQAGGFLGGGEKTVEEVPIEAVAEEYEEPVEEK
ncbi:MAG: ABC transporter ATP-binding protein [Patescibacteria group bacterium]